MRQQRTLPTVCMNYPGGEISKNRLWAQEEDDVLCSLYLTKQRKEIAAILGRSLAMVRWRCSYLGLNCKHPAWTEDDDARLRAYYEQAGTGPVDLAYIAGVLGRSRASVAYRAKRLRLSKQTRRKRVTDAVRASRRGHPPTPGFSGRSHTAKSRAKMSTGQLQRWQNAKATGTGLMSSEARQQRSDVMTFRIAGDERLRRGYSSGRQGKRADLGGQYFRSAWEANIARYLNWLKERGNVYKWEYEPDTFWFHAIKRGVRTYTPDFKIWDTENSEPYYWEVKGYDYARGITARKRMAKYYPHVKLVLVDEDGYKAIAREMRRAIPEWE